MSSVINRLIESTTVVGDNERKVVEILRFAGKQELLEICRSRACIQLTIESSESPCDCSFIRLNKEQAMTLAVDIIKAVNFME